MRTIRERVLALLLALVMVVGVVPMSAFAADETINPGKAIDAAVFYSDLHIKSTTSGGMAEKGTLLKNVLTAMKKGTGLTYSSVTSCGDAFAVNADKTYESGQSKFDGDTATLNKYITGVMGSNVDINYVWSDHDRYAVVGNQYLDCISGLVYGDANTNYYIYELSHADTSTDKRYDCPSHLNAADYINKNKDVTASINAFKEAVKSMDKTKPLIIAAHQPLLDRRNDNGHAYKWATAINEVAAEMDVIYLYGHNHQRDELSDYYYAKGSTMSVCSDSRGNAKDVKLNFSHICTGYMAPVSYNEKTRMGTALSVTIYENAIGCTVYDKNGVLNSATTQFNLDILVEREHEAPATTPETPVQPETPDSVEVTVNGVTATITGVTVSASGAVSAADKALLDAKGYDAYVAMDVKATLTDESATVSFPVPAGWATDRIVGISVENGAVKEIPGTVADGKFTFSVTHFSASGIALLAEGETVNIGDSKWVTITAPTGGSTTYAYTRVNSITAGGEYVIVANNAEYALNYTVNGSGYYANVSMTADPVDVSNDGSTMTSTSALKLWKFSGASGSVTISNGDYTLGYSYGSTGVGSGRTAYVQKGNSNNFIIKRRESNVGYALYYSDNGWTSSNSSTAQYVRLYQLTGSTTVGGTNGLYGTIVGTKNYSVALNTPLKDVLPRIKAGITVVYTEDNTATSGLVYADDGEGMTWTSSNYNSNTPGDYTVDVKYNGITLGTVTVTVTEGPAVQITENGEVVEEVIVRKNAKVGDKVQLGTRTNLTGGTFAWSIPAEYAALATVDQNGLVTLKNNSAHFFVNVAWTINGETYADEVEITATPHEYITPEQGTDDFPEYDNPGAIRFDKTAEAVGNFSETGIAQVELSMTGIPYGSPALDIVVVLDNSSSMNDNATRTPDTIDATMAFLETLTKNSDGTFNSQHNILVADYHGGKLTNGDDPYGAHVYTANEKWSFDYTATNYKSGGTQTSTVSGAFQNIDSDDDLTAIETELKKTYVADENVSGTDYDHALLYAQAALKAARDAGSKNKQFIVMMTDGVPTNLRYEGTKPTYKYSSGASGNTSAAVEDGQSGRYVLYSCTPNNDTYAMFLKQENGTINSTQSNYDFTNRGPNYRYEAVSGDLKAEGVTIYTVGVGLNNKNGAWNYGTYKATAQECYDGASIILNDIAGPAYETTQDTGTALSKKGTYFFELADKDTTGLADAFKNIAGKIAEAATDIVVLDKIANEYTMVFDVPTGYDDDVDANVQEALTGKEFYIEVGNYALDKDHERGAFTSDMRVYLGINTVDGVKSYYAATAAKATNNTSKYANPTFTAVSGAKAYWSVVGSSFVAGPDDILVTVGTTTYRFMELGDGTHNVTAGAYAYGVIDSYSNMAKELVIVTPYFAYSAKTKTLSWTIAAVEEYKEIALRYFLYLDNSSTEIGNMGVEKDPGTYDTNAWAHLTYTNHLGHVCRQEFPVPQLTWNGAQVSYVFYLVNKAGQPINKAGQVVDFANATFITQTFTEAVIWNDTDTPTHDGTQEGVAYLDAQWFASQKLPEGYTLFDQNAYYELKVYEDHEGDDLGNYFKITGSEANGSSISTTKVYNTKGGTRYSAYGTYNKNNVAANFDFANTTVAFAVVWELALVPDTVVVDYGLDVLINVVANDLMQNSLTGLSGTAATDPDLNTGIKTTGKVYTAQEVSLAGGKYTAKIVNDAQIRFHQNDMQFTDPVTFYYGTSSDDYANGEKRTGYMHSSVTVIPATNVYYEDSFVDFKSYTVTPLQFNPDGSIVAGTGTTTADDGTGTWSVTSSTAVQDQDRPGPSKISMVLDADNKYGYDKAYATMSTYSGNSAKITVSPTKKGTATFTFYGTGFDVISLTSSATGVLSVEVYQDTISENEKAVKTYLVDTYYGMTADGTISTNTPDIIYQVPVIKVKDLTYGQYTVVITAAYGSSLDHNKADASYDLYLDAIRVYDPAGNTYGADGNIDTTIQNVYKTDGEAWPIYAELRDKIIDASNVTVTSKQDGTLDVKLNNPDDPDGALTGAVFIDSNNGTRSIAEYISYGPNNEVYLAKNQGIAFNLNVASDLVVDSNGDGTADLPLVADVQLGLKVANGESVTYTINGDTYTVTSATDMFYSILQYAKSGRVFIENTSDAILSITNIKVTHNAAPTTNAIVLTVDEPLVRMALMRMRPVEPEVPVEPETPVEPEVPVEPETPVEPEKPNKNDKPSKNDKPNKPEKPAAPQQPDYDALAKAVVKQIVKTIKTLVNQMYR